MCFVLEWRLPSPANTAAQCVVSYVRVFRSVPAMKAFVCSRRFAKARASELRLSIRNRGHSGSVFTTVPGILSWDPERAAFPAALTNSEWETELDALGLPERILEVVAAELERARARHLLTDDQAQRLRALVAASLAGEAV